MGQQLGSVAVEMAGMVETEVVAAMEVAAEEMAVVEVMVATAETRGEMMTISCERGVTWSV